MVWRDGSVGKELSKQDWWFSLFYIVVIKHCDQSNVGGGVNFIL